jgi:hypothetical protein
MNSDNLIKVEFILNNSLFLSDWENEFMADVYAKTYDNIPLTLKEQDRLDQLYKKLQRDETRYGIN